MPIVAILRMLYHDLQAKKRQRGYWDSLENLHKELDSFIAAELLQPGFVPRPATIAEAGRSDLMKGVARWGGYKEVANLLGYEVSVYDWCYVHAPALLEDRVKRLPWLPSSCNMRCENLCDKGHSMHIGKMGRLQCANRNPITSMIWGSREAIVRMLW